MKKYLEIAKIVATQGVRGELRCQYYCDSPDVLCEFNVLYLGKEKRKIDIERSFPHKNIVIIKIRGVNSIEDAQPYIGKMLYLARTRSFPRRHTSFKTLSDLPLRTLKPARSTERSQRYFRTARRMCTL